MEFKNAPISRRVVSVVVLTCAIVLLFSCGGFVAYELLVRAQAGKPPPVASIVGLGLLVWGGALALSLLLADALRRRISLPLRELTRHARAVSEYGDYSIRAPFRSGDEFGILATAFNQMLDKIQAQTVALEESRSRLEAVINSAMDAIITIDEQQRITMFNQAAETMFKCRASEAVGQSLDRFIPASLREVHRQHVESFARHGVTSRAMGHLQPLSAVRADGGEFPIEASISKTTVGGARVFTVILRDITERRKNEEEIAQLTADLEQRVERRTTELLAANREMEAFTYSVAHDLRAPLRHINAFAALLQEEHAAEFSPEARHHLGAIARHARDMSGLVEDLLNLARIGRQELNLVPTSLDETVQAALRDMKDEMNGRMVCLELKPLPEVRCDPGLMKQVFVNLLSNAVKYTRPREHPIVRVGLTEDDLGPALYVADNGVGFDMDHAEKLFGVFQRLHRVEEFEGTGVGLAIVDRIIHKHGGAIWAEAFPDQGATFYFTLPSMAQWPLAEHAVSAKTAPGRNRPEPARARW